MSARWLLHYHRYSIGMNLVKFRGKWSRNANPGNIVAVIFGRARANRRVTLRHARSYGRMRRQRLTSGSDPGYNEALLDSNANGHVKDSIDDARHRHQSP
jgi:hypothetical protein